MKRYEAINTIIGSLDEEVYIISSTGMISRELYMKRDSSHNLYLLGSMGLSSSVGLGLSLCLPQKRILVLDGDGSILMNLGACATIGHFASKNFLHVVLDNESYGSTGGQSTVSSTTRLDEVALAAGYKVVARAQSEKELKLEIQNLWQQGPTLLLVKVQKGNIKGIGRVEYTPEEIQIRFRQAIRGKL